MGLMAIIIFFYIAVYVALIPRLLRKRDVLSLKFLTFEIVTQNLICILCCSFVNSTVSQFVLLYKELILYGAVLFCFLSKQGKIRNKTMPLCIMAILVFPYFFIGEASLYTKLICFRQIMTPVILMLYGRTLSLKEEDYLLYFKFLIKIGIGIVFIGVIEEFVIGDNFWRLLQIQNYIDMKGFSAWAWDGLPGNFYSADLYLVFGMLRRMVSIMADPLLTGHFLAICVVILLYRNVFINTLQNLIALCLLTLGVALTLSKGAVLVIGIAYAYKLWKKNKFWALPYVVISLIVLVFMIKNNTLYSISQHTGGLISSTNSILGGGLGSAGNYSNLYGNANSDISESYIGALLGQMGLFGVIIFLGMFLYYSRILLSYKKSKIRMSIFAYTLGVICEAFVSESSINFVGVGVVFILFGSLTNDFKANLPLNKLSK